MQTRREATEAGMRGEATARQLEIMAFIRSFRRRTGVSPTYRDIGGHFGIHVNGVRCHIQSMLRKGLLRQAGVNLSRCYVPTDVDLPRCPCCNQPVPDAAD